MKLVPYRQDIFIPNKIEMGLFALCYRKMGGFYDPPGQSGISHLLEHLLCKTFDDMREELKALGINYNAATSDNQIYFYFSGLTESLKEVCERLYNRITKQEGLCTEESFKQEKNTVLQEYGDSFNDQESGFYYNLMRKHYNYCGAIGYRPDIENFSYSDFLVRAKEFSNPSIICQVGEPFVSVSKTLKHNKQPQVKNSPQIKFGNYDLPLESVSKDGKTLVGLLGCKPTDIKDTQIMGFVINCINGGLEAPLYQEIRETRGLSYYSAGEAVYVGERCLPMFFASTTDENVETLEKVYEDFFMLDGTKVISPTRFDTCKKAYAVKKKIADILPHSGAQTTILGDLNPFDGVDTFTYDQVVSEYNRLMKIENYIPVKY